MGASAMGTDAVRMEQRAAVGASATGAERKAGVGARKMETGAMETGHTESSSGCWCNGNRAVGSSERQCSSSWWNGNGNGQRTGVDARAM